MGVTICRNGPRVSHLFFTYDSVIFCRASETECQHVLDILAIYERGSSQKIKKEKTNIFFSSNNPPPPTPKLDPTTLGSSGN